MPPWYNEEKKKWKKGEIMGTLGLYGILSIVLGAIGIIVMLKGKRPTYPSSTESGHHQPQILGS